MFLDIIQTQAIYSDGENASEICKLFWYKWLLPLSSLPPPPRFLMHLVENKVRAEKGVSTEITKTQKEASWKWILEADFSPDPVLACPSGCNGSSPEENVLGGSVTLSE